MLRAAAGERTKAHKAWIDAVEDGGSSAALAVGVAIGMAVLAVVLAVGMLNNAVGDVSTGFMTSGATPTPVASTAR